ncbi:MAG: hypothetical protein ACJAZ1_001386 [Yoonia sp.]|jgi:hypothetical protein
MLMSDLNALVQKLNSLATNDDVFDHGARVISQGGVPAPLNALLDVIDETVLERRLDFAAGDAVVSLIAAGRRLRGLVAVSPANDAAAALIGAPLSRQEPDLLDTAFAVLTETLGAATQLTVRSLPPEPFGTSGERGVTATGLAEIWRVNMHEAPLSPMARFLLANRAALSAVLHVSVGDVLTSQGDISELQSIWDTQVEAFLQSQESLPSHKDGPQLICLDGALERDAAAALVLSNEDVALLVYDPAQLSALQASWRSIFC